MLLYIYRSHTIFENQAINDTLAESIANMTYKISAENNFQASTNEFLYTDFCPLLDYAPPPPYYPCETSMKGIAL